MTLPSCPSSALGTTRQVLPPVYGTALLLAATLALPAPATAQRAERFTEWTAPTFPVAEYVARRAKISAALGPDDVLLVPSVDGVSSGETFRQDDNFEYLVGLELPRSVLIIDNRTRRSWLVAPASDPNFTNPGRPNDFPGRILAGDPAVRALSGVDSVLQVEMLPSLLRSLASQGRRARIDLGRGSATPTASAFQAPTVGQLLAAVVRSDAPAMAIENAFELFASARMIKSPREIAMMREAARITMVAIARGAARVQPGADERALTGAFVADCAALGAPRVAFTPIIKSGVNSLWPWRILGAHYNRRNRQMERGEMAIYDVGCEFEHYVSDVGRTFPVETSFTARQRALVTMVKRVSDAVIAAARPGITLAALQEVAVAAIPAEARPFMQAPLFFGHHLGLDSGDPSIATAPLAAGMVFTIEPWYYNHVDGEAVFIEDEILITATGSENLTAALPRDADGLERMRQGRAPELVNADAARTLTRDGVLSFALDRAAGAVRVADLLNGSEVAVTPVCGNAVGGALSPDDVTFTVSCADGTAPVRINTATHAVDSLPPARAVPGNRAVARSGSPPARGSRKTQVIMIGTIHGAHRTSERFSTDVLRRLLRAIRPDLVLTEIPPNRFAQAMHEFRTTGRIVEPRVVRFPEYVDVLFPLTRELSFTIVPTAGWTRPMDAFRTAALARIQGDTSRREEWREYRTAVALADSIVAARGADDPYYVNSTAYDSVQTAAHEPYNRLFNAELGPGGWDNINRSHFRLIADALDGVRGEGRRVVITYGAGHREWFMRALRKRDDVALLEVGPYLQQIGVPRR